MSSPLININYPLTNDQQNLVLEALDLYIRTHGLQNAAFVVLTAKHIQDTRNKIEAEIRYGAEVERRKYEKEMRKRAKEEGSQ